MHVGDDASLAHKLVRSVRKQMLNAEILQCTDQDTPAVEGISDVYRHVGGDRDKLMLYRLQAFSSLSLQRPALYLDTDMLMRLPIDVPALLNDHDARLCEREFQKDAVFNTKFLGLDFSEYEGKTLGEIYPYIGCATATKTSEFWLDCLYATEALDQKYHRWYCDQEALNIVAMSGNYRIGTLPESTYACLPEFEEFVQRASIVHFKGPRRKALMERFEQLTS